MDDRYSRKRKSNNLIWARDGDGKNAQEHPCYLLDKYCNEHGGWLSSDKVWVEWSSNGTIACIPESRISTTGLSSRRRRTNNNDTKQTGDNNEQTTTNTERAKAIPEQILVEGCALSEVNGTYIQRDKSDKCKGFPLYSKKGRWKGEITDFVFYRDINNSGHGYWYIGLQFESTPSSRFFLPSNCIYKSKINSFDTGTLPPIKGWEAAERGLDPAPTLTYKYKSNDDNITSSVSDSIKVKKEDTKVKKEEYGGETDDEEDDSDRKIAAVPFLVSSSSQLTTKSVYDEDTDDDAAPDPVQSTQLKVKEEAGEDTDDEVAPDTVQSAQVKEEGEDTDDEAPAPDQIQSSQLKSEEDLYGQDTDDEDGKLAPSPVTSAKVKSEHVNSYNMETDDEDNKLDAPLPVVLEAVATKRNADQLNLYKEETHWMFSSAIGTEELLSWNDMEKGSFSNASYVYYSTKDKFYILPEGVYMFWSTLFECKTWGDIRTKYSRGFYVMLMRMYIDNHSLGIDKTRLDGKCFKGDRAFRLSDFNPKVRHNAEHFPILHSSFPPCLEQMQLVSLEKHTFWSFGYNADGCLYFDGSLKKEILDKVKDDYDITPRYESGMAKFKSIDSVYKSHQSRYTPDIEVVEEEYVNDFLCRLVDFESDDDTSKKLNLEKGETEGIYCSRLNEWDDMESGREEVNEFVWMIQETKLKCLPKKVYNFWSRLYDCKTWGDVRANYTKGFYKLLMELRLFSGEDGPSRLEVQEIENKRFEDKEEFDLELCDPGVQEGDACNLFPPHIEYMQMAALEWYCDELFKPFGEWEEDDWADSGYGHLHFDASEKTKVLEAIKGQGWKAQYEPGLTRFSTMY